MGEGRGKLYLSGDEVSNTYFQFKRFRIEQARCAMKVGTDGVLLGAWADLGDPTGDGGAAGRPERLGRPEASPLRLLDIGTGTGLIALMLAQRAASRTWGERPFTVTAVDREAAAAAQAQENAAASPWADRITVVKADIRFWRPENAEAEIAEAGTTNASPANAEVGQRGVDVFARATASSATEAGSFPERPAAPRFDMIVCNPPFYDGSLKGADAARNAARHNDHLKPDELFGWAAAWLKPAPAALNLVLPAEQEAAAIGVAARHHLRPVRRCRVFTAPAAPAPHRVLLAFVRDDMPPVPTSPSGSDIVPTCPHPPVTVSTPNLPVAGGSSRPTDPPLREETLHLYEPSENGLPTSTSHYTNEYQMLVKDFYLHF